MITDKRVYSLGTVDEFELEVLKKYVTPHYTPSARPLIMAVGALFDTEAATIRRFHHDAYQISPMEVLVAGCNTSDTPLLVSGVDGFDFKLFGWMVGDARRDLTWIPPIVESANPNGSYDMAYIRNPDLTGIDEWYSVFAQALRWTGSQGVVASLICRDDVHRFRMLQQVLEDRLNVKPVLVRETGIRDPDDEFDNHYHTIGVFVSQSPIH